MIKYSIHIKQQVAMNLQIKNDPFQYKLSSCLSATVVAALINCKTVFSFNSQSSLNNNSKNKTILYIQLRDLTDRGLSCFCQNLPAYKHPTASLFSIFSSPV